MTGGGKLLRGGSFPCVKRQPWCESRNESPRIDAISLGGNCKWNWERFCIKVEDRKSWRNKEGFVGDPRMRKGVKEGEIAVFQTDMAPLAVQKGVLFACSAHSRGSGKVIPSYSRVGLVGSGVI